MFQGWLQNTREGISLAASGAFGVIEMQKLSPTQMVEFHYYYWHWVGLVLVEVLSGNLEDIPLGWDPARYELTGLTLCFIPAASQQLSVAIFELLETFVCRSSARGRALYRARVRTSLHECVDDLQTAFNSALAPVSLSPSV